MKHAHPYSAAVGSVAKIIAAVTAVAILFFATACDLLASAVTQEEQVTVILPSLPPAAGFSGLHEPVWNVSWYDAQAKRQEQTVKGNRCVIALNKGVCTPVIAETVPSDPHTGPFPPAGSIYPALAEATLDSSTLHADWYGGITAEAARRAFESAQGGIPAARLILSRFNWYRLKQELENLDHPEYVDYNRLVTALLSGHVRVYDIRMLPLRAILLKIPAAIVTEGSNFYSAWPGPPVFSWTDTHPCSLEVPRITTRFYSNEGCITVFPASPTGECVFFFPYSLQE